MAEIAVALWTRHLRHNPAHPHWPDRDRFVLSNGHGSMLQYALLHLMGYAVSIEEIKRFRQLGSITPGHPEVGVTPGVETTTGPLGQGLANAVGMILDIGPQSVLALRALVARAGTIVWNGPVGVFEFDAFAGGTRELAQAVAESAAYSIAGGGDTVAAINKFGVANRIDYISTAGGAFLEFLEGKALPAVAVLESRADD